MSVELFNKQTVAKSFGKAAENYDSVAHFQRWVGSQLLQKIPLTKTNVNTVLDLGCGTGYFSRFLQEQYPAAGYIGLDLSEDMIRFAQDAHLKSGGTWLAGDAESLPLKSNSVDLVFSSLSVQWCGDLSAMFSEVERVLSDQGVFVFSSLVEGSLKELKDAWSQVDDMQHVNEFSQYQDYQNGLQSSGLHIHTLEEEQKVLHYQKLGELTKELKTLGAHNMTSHRPTNITGKQKIKKLLGAYEDYRLDDGTLPASYQVLWGVMRNEKSKG